MAAICNGDLDKDHRNDDKINTNNDGYDNFNNNNSDIKNDTQKETQNCPGSHSWVSPASGRGTSFRDLLRPTLSAGNIIRGASLFDFLLEDDHDAETRDRPVHHSGLPSVAGAAFTHPSGTEHHTPGIMKRLKQSLRQALPWKRKSANLIAESAAAVAASYDMVIVLDPPPTEVSIKVLSSSSPALVYSVSKPTHQRSHSCGPLLSSS